MTTIKNFEDIDIWKLSRQLGNLVHSDFRDSKDYGFKDQVTRAGVSIMNNISEGISRGGNAEFRQFLKISKGSAGEVETMFYIAGDQSYLNIDIASDRRQKAQNLINSLGGFIKYLRQFK